MNGYFILRLFLMLVPYACSGSKTYLCKIPLNDGWLFNNSFLFMNKIIPTSKINKEINVEINK